MARIKVTSSDINAKLAKGECANYRNNGCQGRIPCMVLQGEACQYFATYVKPLLDHAEYLYKYGHEAKIAVALNPKAKVVRKRRLAAEPKLSMKTEPSAPAPLQAAVTPTAKPVLPAQRQPVATSPAQPALTAQRQPAATPPAKPRVPVAASLTLAAAAVPANDPTPTHPAKKTRALPLRQSATQEQPAAPPTPAVTPAAPARVKTPLPPLAPMMAAVTPPAPARDQAPLPALRATTPSLPAEPALTLLPPPAPAYAAPESLVLPATAPRQPAPPAASPAPAPIVLPKPPPVPEQPQLFGDLFATTSTPRSARKR